MRPFFKEKNNKKLCLSVIFGIPPCKFLLYYLLYWISVFVRYSIPQTFTVYQTLALYLLAMCFGEFLGFLGLNSILCWLGTVSNRPGLFQLEVPVRISLWQFYVGICLFETVPDWFWRGHFQILHRPILFTCHHVMCISKLCLEQGVSTSVDKELYFICKKFVVIFNKIFDTTCILEPLF